MNLIPPRGTMACAALPMTSPVRAHSRSLAALAVLFVGLAANSVHATAGALLVTIPAPGNSAGFGHSLAVGANQIAVGDYNQQLVYRYDATGNRLATYQPNLSAWGGLGCSVAFDGQLVLAGGPFEYTNDSSNTTGREVLFNATNGQVLQSQKGPNFSYYGWSTALSNSFYAIGANYATNSNSPGMVQIYDRATMTLRTTLNGTGGNFGNSMAASSNLLTVGAPNLQVGSSGQAGSAFVYDASSGQLLKTLVSPNIHDINFGRSVAQRNGQILVGAPYAVGGGAAYLFDSSTGMLLQSFHDPLGNSQDAFGWSVAFAQDSVVIGAPNTGVNSAQIGAAYAFDIATGALDATFRETTPITGAQFGWAVAGLGDLAVVSSDANGQHHGGDVYVFSIPEPASLGLLGLLGLPAAALLPKRRASRPRKTK